MIHKIKEAAKYIKSEIKSGVETALILGSGLGDLAEELLDKKVIKYKDIPNFPVSTVQGHLGQFVFGRINNKQIMVMQGRFHYYEGYSMDEIVLPIRIMHKLGIKKLIITNAAGGININYNPGNFMIIQDHINLMGDNPLRGKNLEEFGPRFPDMSEIYNEELRELAYKKAVQNEIKVVKGVYVGLMGPSYETPAEIRYLRKAGADAVGMSTVPEAITANHMGFNILGISCITNMAAGVLPQPLDHKEVMKVAEEVKLEFSTFIKAILKEV